METGYLKAVGAQNAVLPGGPSFATEADVLELAEKMNALGKKFREEGIRLGYHNHSHDSPKTEIKGLDAGRLIRQYRSRICRYAA